MFSSPLSHPICPRSALSSAVLPLRALPCFGRVAAGTHSISRAANDPHFCFGEPSSRSRGGNMRQFVFARIQSSPRFRSCSHASCCRALPLLARDTSSCKKHFIGRLSLFLVQRSSAGGEALSDLWERGCAQMSLQRLL